jgi:hypothetical protein
MLSGLAYAGNAALSQALSVPAGERIANYLQTVMSPVGEVVTAWSPGDVFSPKDPFHLAFNYNPETRVINIYLTGKLEKSEDIKPIFDLTQKLILRLNGKIQKIWSHFKSRGPVDGLFKCEQRQGYSRIDGKFLDKSGPETALTPATSVDASSPYNGLVVGWNRCRSKHGRSLSGGLGHCLSEIMKSDLNTSF